MNTTPRPKPNSGHLLLAFVLLIACVIILFVAIKLIECIYKNPPDPWRGQDTNLVDITFAPQLDKLMELVGSNSAVSVTLTQFNLTLNMPVSELGYVWRLSIESSTNLQDWTIETNDWDSLMSDMTTNRSLPCKFYRRRLLY